MFGQGAHKQSPGADKILIIYMIYMDIDVENMCKNDRKILDIRGKGIILKQVELINIDSITKLVPDSLC